MDRFEYIYKGKSIINGVTTEIYAFKCKFNNSYVLEVELFENDIQIIKYYQKNHRDSEKRYSLMNDQQQFDLKDGKPFNSSTNVIYIMNTIRNLMVEKLRESKKISFGFMGAPKEEELDIENNGRNINSDGTVRNTQRANIYTSYVDRYFAPDKFIRRSMESSSSHMISHIENNSLTDEIAEEFFINYINNYG
ncbi:hypothetical protein LX97_00810 [Nonlabens dokdonensis]|uniref:Uncharacterized protein n=2 Tax=Nonlabens dokdonensis TaxID=328515 RepID=L7W7L1_NONDD|nr:hypothetical protein [Nonlabens dokdonensis]AGC76134.1 hypothetical protein DDD_1007 [Nonlabens dokdonensis DSW-6]PZX43805.1 hypothetical protein LX97_00810 [Nonlabens dokdonensis]